jgi:hypothetical protein
MNGSLLHYALMSVDCSIIVVVTCIRGNNALSCALLKIHAKLVYLDGQLEGFINLPIQVI